MTTPQSITNRNLVNKNGTLTPLGRNVIALYTAYTAAGYNLIDSTQLIGGQIGEIGTLSPIALQGHFPLPVGDTTVAQALSALDQLRANENPETMVGFGISQWTSSSRQSALRTFLASQDPNSSALATEAQFTLQELDSNASHYTGIILPFLYHDNLSPAENAAAAQAWILQHYEVALDRAVPGDANFDHPIPNHNSSFGSYGDAAFHFIA
jgi:hypothetical protein